MSFWNDRPLIITIILVIVLIVLLFATTDTEGKNLSIIGNLIAPAQGGLYRVTSDISAFLGRLFSTSDLAKENLALTEQLERLQTKLGDYEELQSENARLKKQLGVLDTYPEYESLTARVIGNTPGGWFKEFTINAGTVDGIKEGMIVVTSEGLMGRIFSAAGNHSRVMSLVNDKSGVSVLVERTRDTGVVKTDPTLGEGMLEIQYLSADADVVPGDKLVTSGLGGLYPKGIVVGIVSEVSSDIGAEKKVLVKSAVDFKHVEEVVVLKYLFEEVEE